MDFARRYARSFLAWSAIQNVERRVQRAAGPGVGDIFTYTFRPELAKLYRLARDAPSGASALEIGSHLGASACYIATAMAECGGRLYCVDTWNNETMPEGEQDTLAAFMANTRRLATAITPIRKRSQDLLESDVKPPIGFVFIDGDHSYEACLRDFERIKTWVSPNGIVAFHDAITPSGPPIFPGVQRVVGMAMESGQWQLGGLVQRMCWITRVPG